MAKKLAKITLVGPLSLAVGRYRFHKGKEVTSEDAELIKYCSVNPDFKVVEVEIQTPKAEAKAPASPKSEPKAKPTAVEPDEEEVEESEEVVAKESKSSSRLARKSKGDGA